MDSIRLSTIEAGVSMVSYRSGEGATAGTAPTPSRHVYTLPAWVRHGTQPDYWSERWYRKERLADWDREVGSTYEATNMDDVIRQLDEGLDAAQAN